MKKTGAETRFRVRIKNFRGLPKGIDAKQRQYAGKIVSVRAVPLIVAWVFEQDDPSGESKFGKWIWPKSLITSISKRKKS